MSPYNIFRPTYEQCFTVVLFLFFLAVFSIHKQLSIAFYLMALFGIYALKIKKIQFNDIPKEAALYFYSVVLLVMLITLSASIYNPDALIRYRYVLYRDLILLPFVLLGFMAANIRFDMFLKLMVLASVITLVWVVMIIIEQPPRHVGWLSRPIERGNTGMLAGMVCLTALIYFDSWKWRIIATIGFVSGVGLSLLSGSRGGWVAMFIVIPTLFYQLAKSDKATMKHASLVLGISMVAVFLFWDLLPISKRLNQTISSLQSYFLDGNAQTALGIRFDMWKASWYSFLEKPIFGWGWYNFKQIFIEYQKQGIITARYRVVGNPHNQYLSFLAEMGLVGAISFLAFLIYPFQYFSRKFIRINSTEDRYGWEVCLLLLVVYEVILEFCMSDSTLSQKSFLLFFTTLTIFSFVLLKQEKEKKD